jgi:hypothetical protein
MLLTEDIGRGQSRWFRGKADFKVMKLASSLGSPRAGIWGTRPDEKVTSARMKATEAQRQTNWWYFLYQQLTHSLR